MATLPEAGTITAQTLRALPEGSLVVTHGVGWAKIGPDRWSCAFSLGDKHRDSAWLSQVAKLIVFNPDEWAL